MSFQSSFLIRCRLVQQSDSGITTNYAVQHVQTGIEFASSSLAEITSWIAEQNIAYMQKAVGESQGDGQ